MLAAALALAITPAASASAASGHHRLSWGQVTARCHHTGGCRPVPGWLRTVLHLGHHRALVRWGGTTVIWVRLPDGRVLVITS